MITLVATRAKATGPVRRVKVRRNTEVQIVVTSDVNDQLHLHGYDKTVKVEPGAPTALNFKADKSGLFEVELENTSRHVLTITVS